MITAIMRSIKIDLIEAERNESLTLKQDLVRFIRHVARRDDLANMLQLEVDGTIIAWLGAPGSAPTENIHPNAVLYGQRIKSHIAIRLPPNENGERLLPEGSQEMTEDDFN